MSVRQGGFLVPAISDDQRVRVFRRNFTAPGEFDGMEVAAYAVITDRYIVVCDTLLCPEDMIHVMQQMRDVLPGRQVLVVNSHADWDHVWGNCYFTGVHAAPIIAHEHCLTRLRSSAAQLELRDYQRRYALFQNVTITLPTLTFTDVFTIHGGNLTVELMPAAGHHQDHIAVWIPELRLLLAFDAVERPFPVIENPASVPTMFHTLERLLAMQPRRVLSSHSRSANVATVEQNLVYLREIEQRARLLVHSPTSAELEHASELIHSSFKDALAAVTTPAEIIDRTFYSWAHENNVRCIIQWLFS
jgi:glyoxylase-like metal-dependent hydrolase (beta-lactamase superfamily II)